jgi:hypothetical protein
MPCQATGFHYKAVMICTYWREWNWGYRSAGGDIEMRMLAMGSESLGREDELLKCRIRPDNELPYQIELVNMS